MDLSIPAGIVSELFDPDEGIKKEFNNRFSTQILQFAEAYAPAFKRFEKYAQLEQHSFQPALVVGLLHGVLDDLLTSTKLLLTGKLSASGNLMRQATEGLCMTVMCAHSGTLSIGNKEQCYWELLKAQDPAAEGHIAPKQFEKNWERLGLNQQGAQQLKRVVDTHHAHSHAGHLAMANRMDLGPDGKIHFGGHFDPAKTKGYELEFTQRINLCKTAIETMDVLDPRLMAMIEKKPVAEPASNSRAQLRKT